jgi:CRISPR system Cascade subunit CasA
MVEIVKKGLFAKKLKKNENDKYQQIKNRVKEKYLIYYWTLIEKQRQLLMRYISLVSTEKDEAREQAKKTWLKEINHAADNTYQTLCSQESQREMRAYVAGWQILHPTYSIKKEAA